MGGDKDAWDICEPWCRTYLSNASAGGKAQVVIISIAASQREDVNVWETNQFLVPSSLLMWFWRFISRSISVTCSLVSETNSGAYPDLFSSRLLVHRRWLIYWLYSTRLTHFFLWCACFYTLLQQAGVKLSLSFWKFMYLRRGADIKNKKSYDGKPRNVFFSWAAATGLLWLNSMLAFENNSTLLIFYLIYSEQAFPHQARVLILSQNKSVSLFSDMLSLHQQQKENLQPQDYITAKQCLFLPERKFFLLPGISKTGEIWKTERGAAKNK